MNGATRKRRGAVRRLCRIAAVLAVAVWAAPAASAADKPNIVVILADDLGWADVGYHAPRIRTPHIDRLAGEGVRLERFYVSPTCSPTRAGLLTGRYPIRFGMSRAVIPPWRNFGLDPAEVTLPQVLAQAGYQRRGIFGKWHLGHHARKWHPLSRGFTHFRGHYNGAIDYFTHLREGERDWHVDYEPSDEQGYTTDLIADAAARFITESAKDGPFLCYVPFNAPHSPFQAPEKYLKMYEGLAGEGKDARRQTLAAMVTCMDDGIGRILASIDRAGVRDNTIVWFFSDNGGVSQIPDNNLPLRGNKLDVFEGGVRVPACVRWPQGLKGGRTVTAPLACVDLLPTLMRVAGVRDHGGKPLDGVDALAVLTGEKKTLERELFFYHGQSGPQNEKIALTTPEWKLVILGPNVAEGIGDEHQRLLFRIVDDPYEKTDLAAAQPAVVKTLTQRIVELRRQQPENSVAPYSQGGKGFTAPKDWRIPAK